MSTGESTGIDSIQNHCAFVAPIDQMRETNSIRRAADALAGGRGRRAALGLWALSLLAACSDPGIVTVQAELREAPASESKLLAVIPKGSAIRIGDCSNGWCRVSWDGRDGYMLTKSVRLGGGARSDILGAGQPEEIDDDASPAAPDGASVTPSAPE